MAVIKTEFFLALNQVATERGISLEDVLESIKSAVLAAYKKDYGEGKEDEENEEVEEKIEVEIDKDSGETKLLKEGKDVTPPGFGRIAAQTARQVILQKIREAEKRTIVEHYASQIGTIIKGRVIRLDGKDVYLDIGRAEGFLPLGEQIRKESYKLNDNLVVYIKEILKDSFDNSKIIVSRADPKLLKELFKKEVPEINNNTVKVKNVVREPGERAKIAVYSDQSGVDPVGACVGQKGIRVKAVTGEIGGEEKIDIIQYNPDDVTFIREALSPATVTSVEINKEKKSAKVLVDGEQAPLAIGKKGVNVNLASRLTGYELDIVQIPSSEKKPSAVKASGDKPTSAKATEGKLEGKKEQKEKKKKETKKKKEAKKPSEVTAKKTPKEAKKKEDSSPA